MSAARGPLIGMIVFAALGIALWFATRVEPTVAAIEEPIEEPRGEPAVVVDEDGVPIPPLIRGMDQDGDGRVSRDEFTLFDELDENNDGFIDGDEARQSTGRRNTEKAERALEHPGFIGRWDADQDGRVSAEEFTGPPERFAGLDADADGFIDSTEAPVGPPGQRAKPGPP